MRIGIDFTPAVEEQAGIGRITRELVHALLELDQQHHYVLLAPRGAEPPHWVTERPRARWAPLPVSAHMATVLWHRLSLPITAEQLTGPIDLFHGTDYLLPPLQRARGLVTIHDLSFRALPDLAEPALVRYLEPRVPSSLKRATLVLADSEHTKADILKHYQLAPEKVAVVYGGVRSEFRPVEDPHALQELRSRYELPEAYLLTVGRLEPRKNLVTLLQVYRMLLDRNQPVPQLVIAGGKGWRYEPIFQAAEELRLGEAVRFLGYVPDADLPALLSGATAFLYLSFYEGFGLPPLEALACGTPVLASNTSSLPEVLGDAAFLVSPHDPEAILGALTLLLSDASLRQELRQRGYAQATRFTWAAAALQLLAAYELAASPAFSSARS